MALVLLGVLGSSALAQRSAHMLSAQKISSPPAGAKAGHSYTLHGKVHNAGRNAVSGTLVVHALHPGDQTLTVGAARVHAGRNSSATFSVRVSLPSNLGDGSWSLVACAKHGGDSGALGCVTARRRIQVGGGDSIVGPKVDLNQPLLRQSDTCVSGAHTLTPAAATVAGTTPLPVGGVGTYQTTNNFGWSRTWPEVGNGGYTSVHTDIDLNYDANTNTMLPGNHVVLTDQANQCLANFSLDFQPINPNRNSQGPTRLTVGSITVNGQPATFKFVQPTYPGDPVANGTPCTAPDTPLGCDWSDPDPTAHMASQLNPVSATINKPPACTPNPPTTMSNTFGNNFNGTQCLRDKLQITPSSPVPNGSTFTVDVNYTGTAGVHDDGDGTDDGWFLDTGGQVVCSEPVGSEDWMPMNDSTGQKPTYDFNNTTNAGKTNISNGELVSYSDNPANPQFTGNEVQNIQLSPNTGGTFTLTFGAGGVGVATTNPIAAAASAATVQTELNNLTNINTGGGSVSVTGPNGGPYVVTFDGGPLAGTNVAQITASVAGLTSGVSVSGAGDDQTVTVNAGTGNFTLTRNAQTTANIVLTPQTTSGVSTVRAAAAQVSAALTTLSQIADPANVAVQTVGSTQNGGPSAQSVGPYAVHFMGTLTGNVNNALTANNVTLAATSAATTTKNGGGTGSRTWHWHSPEPITTYEVENSMGSYDLTERIGDDGIQYYVGQNSNLSVAQKNSAFATQNQQEDIVNFQSQFNGTYPHTSDGDIVALASTGFSEEMQTKIISPGGSVGLGTLAHENMHQWFGDSVSGIAYYMTYFKEGGANYGGTALFNARAAETAAGGQYSAAGQAAFNASLVTTFNGQLATNNWTLAPSNTGAVAEFNTFAAYNRTMSLYLGLRTIMGNTQFYKAWQQFLKDYYHGAISEPQFVAEFQAFMPNQSPACHQRLADYFTQWYDGSFTGSNKPTIAGVGTNGNPFYNNTGGCS